MSVLQPPPNATNVLQLSNNMLATNGVNICQMWATTPIPTTPKVAASVMLVAPQYFGHFSWFLVKSSIINFARSLQPTQTERAFPLTWDDQENVARFSVGNRTFMLSFANSSIFWCFKYMAYCRDQIDTNCIRPFNAEMLLDAFVKFKIPAQIPLGTGRETGEGMVREDSPEEHKYANQAVAAPSGEVLHVHPSAASPEVQGSFPTVTHNNRHNSPTRPPTLVPLQEGLSPASANIQPVADAMRALSAIGDGCQDCQNAVSHKKRKHDMG
ncbi:hypothetical protein EDD15DRAFT_2376754 [Pisolithus albus]|nr:hypothetical protein EDD15DRAFT_2376754 [Pisolithus albus]